MNQDQRGDRSRPASGSEAEEELLFHLRSLIEENTARGMTPAEAWDDAQSRFGSLNRYARECDRIDRGHSTFGKAGAAAALLVAFALAGWQFLEARMLRRQLQAVTATSRKAEQAARLLADAARRPAAVENVRRETLVGQVLETGLKPVAGANVLVILKTWPGNRFRQEDFFAKTDSEGRFQLSELVPVTGRYAIQVAAVRDGYTLGSTYQLVDEDQHPPAAPVALTLEPATPLMLQFQDAAGKPIPGTRVLASGRETADGQSHSVYFQASEPIQVVADDQGRVPMNCFKPGDRAEITVRRPGGDWDERRIEIPSDTDVLVVAL